MDTDNASSVVQERIAPSADGAASEAARVTLTQHACLDDYEIIREIGRGGTAIVYEAFHRKLRRRVALKRLPAAAELDPRWRDRFDNEVRATSRLTHPNIVPFYELGQGGTNFYTMQLVDGISLAEVIHCLRQCRAGGRPCLNRDADAVHPAFLQLCHHCKCRVASHPAETNGKPTDLIAGGEYHRAIVEFTREVALAVQYAHDQGILHLDIKPSNILIDGEGKVWVTDFGAAKNNGATGAERLSGTLCYASPEQALGRDEQLDERSDVYSLGATLYELLTLERPFADDSAHALVAQVSIGTLIDPNKANNAIPSELNTIINKAMARDRDQRHATITELSDDLEKYLKTPTKLPTQEKRTTPYLARIFAAVLVTVAVFALFAVASLRTDFPTPVYEWNGHFYALTESEMDWESAEAEAVSHGGHLITINDEKEQAFVEKKFFAPRDQAFWIGLTDAEKEGDWHWVSGQPIEFTAWEFKGEPNNVRWRHPVTGQTIDEDYAVIHRHFKAQSPRRRSGTWNDVRSVPNDDRIMPYHGIMEFESDPR